MQISFGLRIRTYFIKQTSCNYTSGIGRAVFVHVCVFAMILHSLLRTPIFMKVYHGLRCWYSEIHVMKKRWFWSFCKILRYKNITSHHLSSFSSWSYLTKLPVHMWYQNHSPKCLYELYVDQQYFIYLPSSANKRRWPLNTIHRWTHTGLHFSPMVGTNGVMPLIGTIREPEGRLDLLHCLKGNLRSNGPYNTLT